MPNLYPFKQLGGERNMWELRTDASQGSILDCFDLESSTLNHLATGAQADNYVYNCIYNKILDRDWFSVCLFAT